MRIIKTGDGFCFRKFFFVIHLFPKFAHTHKNETNTSPCVSQRILFLSVTCSFTILITPSFSFSFLKTLSDALALTMKTNKATNFF